MESVIGQLKEKLKQHEVELNNVKNHFKEKEKVQNEEQEKLKAQLEEKTKALKEYQVKVIFVLLICLTHLLSFSLSPNPYFLDK